MKNTTIKTLLHTFLIGICLLSLNTRAGVEITYIHNDALGAPVAGTDEQGNVKWRAHYQPYGEELLGERQLFGVRAGFTGQRADPDTGLTYMGARYYSPTIGRFMGMDPAGVNEKNIHSFNRYAYANNNPYKYIDPDGLESMSATFFFPPTGGFGGTFEVGKDPSSELPFVRMKVGFGFGAGFVVDPNGGLPRADELANTTGKANNIGMSAEVGVTVLNIGIGVTSELLKTKAQDGSGAITSAVTDPTPKFNASGLQVDERVGFKFSGSINMLDISTTLPGVSLTDQFRQNDEFASRN